MLLNLFDVIRELGQLPRGIKAVYLHLRSRVPLVDHTTGEVPSHFLEEFSDQDQSPKLVIEGWDHMRPPSKHETRGRSTNGLMAALTGRFALGRRV
ncbi:hypothetical protein [Mycobacterium malmoense]|uniref:hypothetical protein n=1 Tax=Mycobacterium malmoense TaxID=1780 RepID=UPI0008F8D1DF|nr:hypothetical protein [Mycobacterium malmoense]OIN79320.1 hypothetical protein BMG05_18710 [Mycobacterium malmoense]